MKEYKPEQLAAISRYQNYFPTLPIEIRSDIYQRMEALIEEEKEFCDKGNYTNILNYVKREHYAGYSASPEDLGDLRSQH